jgi:hypothetical protein
MAGKKSDKKSAGGPFRFRVSDALAVPLRGFMLRLRLLDGSPAIADLGPGKLLRLKSPTGATRNVRVKDFSLTAGNATQEVLDRNRLADVIISESDARANEDWIDIGWEASGPVNDEGDEAAA